MRSISLKSFWLSINRSMQMSFISSTPIFLFKNHPAEDGRWRWKSSWWHRIEREKKSWRCNFTGENGSIEQTRTFRLQISLVLFALRIHFNMQIYANGWTPLNAVVSNKKNSSDQKNQNSILKFKIKQRWWMIKCY